MKKKAILLFTVSVLMIFSVTAIVGIKSFSNKQEGALLLPTQVLYQAPQFSFYQTTETSPDFLLDNNNILFERNKGDKAWQRIGKLSKITLSKENLDNRFLAIGIATDFVPEKIREENSQAFQVKYKEERLYMVLKQKNGDYYVCYGYYELGVTQPETKDNSFIRWVYKISVQNPDWGIEMKVQDVTPTGLTLKIKNNGGKTTGQLQYGSDYWIESYLPDAWQRLPYRDPDTHYAFTMEAYTLDKNGTDEKEISWEYMYGTLEKGKYRICKHFNDFRSTGDYDQRIAYAEFVID